MSHESCKEGAGHTCMRPSGQQCREDGCTAQAGTRWGPHWCPVHDEERLDRISAMFDAMVRMRDTTPR